jgi:thiosulfate dehydrogenase
MTIRDSLRPRIAYVTLIWISPQFGWRENMEILPRISLEKEKSMSMTKGLRLLFAFGATTLVAGCSTMAPVAGDVEGMSGKELAQIAHGGLLYDKWYAVLDVKPPEATHPAYANSEGKREGSGTWRCKECHGWDYMGKDGAYAKGSHFSGIPGIRGGDGGSVSKVASELGAGVHGLGKYASQEDLQAMAAFVVYGQVDMDQYIDRASKKAKGNAAQGEGIYLTICAKCHGADGKKSNFGSKDKPVYMGTVANGNPWETLHKIRMGQPKEDMPGMIAFPIGIQVDVLTYAQTLPEK